MPVMNGLDCTRRIRELEKEGSIVGHVPIIAVTANVSLSQSHVTSSSFTDNKCRPGTSRSKPYLLLEWLVVAVDLYSK